MQRASDGEAPQVREPLSEPDTVESTLRELEEVKDVTREILSEAREAANPMLALRALDRLTKQLELLARLRGEFRTTVTHAHVNLTPQLDALREVLLRALQPYPDARIAAASALQEIARLPAGRGE